MIKVLKQRRQRCNGVVTEEGTIAQVARLDPSSARAGVHPKSEMLTVEPATHQSFSDVVSLVGPLMAS